MKPLIGSLIAVTRQHNYLFCVAPMMGWSDRHGRFLHRILSRHAWLYTEMITANSLIHGQADRLLRFDSREHPVVLQLGGRDPANLAQAACMGADWGYDQIDLNLGCPSRCARSGGFGAALMMDPKHIAACFAAMRASVSDKIPISVKCRLGIIGEEVDLDDFVKRLANEGCQVFVIHARKACLNGLSPKKNRTIPALDYERVIQIKQNYPELTIILNGGLNDLACALRASQDVDGVMMGRAAYRNPWTLAKVDSLFFGCPDPIQHRADVAWRYLSHMEAEYSMGTPLPTLIKPLVGLFHQCAGARHWRRVLSEARSGNQLKAIAHTLISIDQEKGSSQDKKCFSEKQAGKSSPS